MITRGLVYLIRDKNGREVSSSMRMTDAWQAKLESEGHEVFAQPFELPGPKFDTIPCPPPSTHGCWEGMDDT